MARGRWGVAVSRGSGPPPPLSEDFVYKLPLGPPFLKIPLDPSLFRFLDLPLVQYSGTSIMKFIRGVSSVCCFGEFVANWRVAVLERLLNQRGTALEMD